MTCKNEIGSISTKIKIEAIDIGRGNYSDYHNVSYDDENHKVDFSREGYFVFNHCFTEGIYQIKCYCSDYITIAVCTTSNNNGYSNIKYDIADGCIGKYIILFDLVNKQIGYRNENEKDMKIVRTFSDKSLYLIVESRSGSRFFKIKDIERID